MNAHNRYSYCLNSPLRYTDPTGYYSTEAAWANLQNGNVMTAAVGMGGGVSVGGGASGGTLGMVQQAWNSTPAGGVMSHFYSNGVLDFSVEGFALPAATATGYWRNGRHGREWITTGVGFPEGWGNSGQGGDFLGNLDTGLDAFEAVVGAKTGLIDYAIRTNYKSARSYRDFNKLRSTQKAWRTTNTLGKGGASYLNTFKIIGRATGIASAGLAINDAIQNPTTGNIIQAFATTGLALVRINPLVGIGLGIMDVTGTSDYLYDQLGNSIDNY